MNITVKDKTFTTYISSVEIQERIQLLGKEISADFSDNEITIVSVLNGSFIFTADLCRQIEGNVNIQFLRVFSYHGTASTGKITELMGLNESLKNKHVVIVEDIIDTGLTIDYIYKSILSHEPASLKIATLLLKEDIYNGNLKIDYIGFRIPNRFVIGYGLDLDGLGRNLPEIYQAI
jgi:hypoxanthine phosphoribosyltransferase